MKECKSCEWNEDAFCDRYGRKILDEDDTCPYGDQTAKADAGKPRLSLVPMQGLWDAARIREYGTKKYGAPNNWKRVEVERYRDAALRHYLKYLEDPGSLDEESGLPHLWHCICNLFFLCDMEAGRWR